MREYDIAGLSLGGRLAGRGRLPRGLAASRGVRRATGNVCVVLGTGSMGTWLHGTCSSRETHISELRK